MGNTVRIYHSNDGKLHTEDRHEAERYRDQKGIGFAVEEKMKTGAPKNKMETPKKEVKAETESKPEAKEESEQFPPQE